MNPTLNTVTKDNAATNILFQSIPTFSLKFFTLLGITLIDILHHRIWTTNGGQPNQFGVTTINGLNDSMDTLVRPKVTIIEQGTAFSR